MQYNRKIHEVEKGVSVLRITHLSQYLIFAEKRSRQRTILLQAMTLGFCTAGAVLAPQYASLSPDLLKTYGLAMLSTTVATAISRGFVAGSAARVCFVAISAHLLCYITASSPQAALWHSAICALIMVAMAPLHNEPISHLVSSVLIGAILILPHHSELAVSAEGAWIGCLMLCAMVFGSVINGLFFIDRLTRHQLNLRLVELAYRDSLTQINNRRALLDELEFALRRLHGSDLHFLLIDVDNFKSINDAQGHDVGDAVLRTLAGQIKSVVGESHCGRLGGEEFGVFVSGDRADAEALALRLHALRRAPGPDGVTATISIGIAKHVPGFSISHLFKMADRALYAAKRAGKNCHRYADITTISSTQESTEGTP